MGARLCSGQCALMHACRVGRRACDMDRCARMRACGMERHAYVHAYGVNRHAYMRTYGVKRRTYVHACGFNSRALGPRLMGEKLRFFNVFYVQYG
jgi:hypothetical protein